MVGSSGHVVCGKVWKVRTSAGVPMLYTGINELVGSLSFLPIQQNNVPETRKKNMSVV